MLVQHRTVHVPGWGRGEGDLDNDGNNIHPAHAPEEGKDAVPPILTGGQVESKQDRQRKVDEIRNRSHDVKHRIGQPREHSVRVAEKEGVLYPGESDDVGFRDDVQVSEVSDALIGGEHNQIGHVGHDGKDKFAIWNPPHFQEQARAYQDLCIVAHHSLERVK